ncbi:MAG: NAD(P)/FAD-dependent oxidoreductase [Methanomicrobiales archaeon]|nr:NAD(P)/FAD-dependent oxidoreductase [Methanomicrobiales archaeon]
MRSEYDLLVIGGGPGGAIAAKTAAEKGLNVCLIEKRPAIGAPVRCAEGIGRELLEEFIEPDERWISSEIDGAKIIAPNGTALVLEPQMAGNEVGYILDRKVFDRELVWQAAEAGSDVMVKTRAISPLMKNGKVGGAHLEFCGIQRDVRAEVVIAADGVESKFARWCGIDTTIPYRELATCAQYLLTNIDIEPRTTIFYLGNRIAPEGYVWVFPKGERSANVGIGISPADCGPGQRPRDLLDAFVKSNLPTGRPIECVVGGVPVCEPLKSTVSDGLMIVGDAARVSDPLTGGGIYNAMFTGKLAAEVASECISRGDCSQKALEKYDSGWRDSRMGKALARNYRIKEFFIKLSDEKLNLLVESAAKINLKEFSTLTLIKELIVRNPSLLLELKSLRDSIR